MSAAATQLTPPLRGATAHLADELQAGRVYPREELARLSNAVDQHLNELVPTGVFKKLAQGLYYALRRLLLARSTRSSGFHEGAGVSRPKSATLSVQGIDCHEVQKK